MYFTQASYCRAVRCKKQLWLDKHKPDAFNGANAVVYGDEEKIRMLAAELFGGCVHVSHSDNTPVMIAETKHLIDAKTQAIADAAFIYGGCFCTVDILKRTKSGYELYLVKSTTHIREIHIHAAAYQLFVLRGAGINVTSAHIIHVNGGYVREGALETESFLIIEDVTENAEVLCESVKKTVNDTDIYVMSPNEPTQRLCEQCFEPYECGYFGWCARNIPRHSVFDVSRMNLTEKLVEYNKGNVTFADLMNNGAALNDTQLLQVKSELDKLPPHIERTKIAEFMADISYPVYFLDFETCQPSVPLYDGIRPLMQVPFQYSLHYVNRENGTLHHREYLAGTGYDCRRELAERLCGDIPENVCVTAYNTGFEKSRIKELAEQFPELAPHLMAIHGNMRDLMIPFQQRWYYDRKMEGSYSIKYVLPAICPGDPELDYKNLEEIHNGNEAATAFSALSEMSAEDAERTRKNLLAYCRLDTLALVKVWEKLRRIKA